MSVVLDASALLALVQQEPGGERVAELLDGAAVSAVNWSEVRQKLAQYGADGETVTAGLRALGVSVEPFTEVDADRAAWLYPLTKARGLSLADRSCLALAFRLGGTAVTAEREWSRVSGLDIEVEAIR